MRKVASFGLLIVVLTACIALAQQPPISGEQKTVQPPFRKLWTLAAKDHFQNFIVTADTVYFSTLMSYGAADLATGKRLWEKAVNDDRIGYHVAFDGQTLYVGIGERQVVACEPKTGRALWRLPLRTKDYPGPMTVADGVLYSELSVGTLSAIDTSTHQPHWTARLKNDKLPAAQQRDGLSAEPLVTGARLLVATEAGELLCLNRQTGAVQWRAEFSEGGYNPVSGLAVQAESVYCTTWEGDLVALSMATGQVRWRFETDESAYGGPVVQDDLILYTVRDGSLYAVQAADGHLKWERSLIPPDPPDDRRPMDPDTSAPTLYKGQIVAQSGSRLLAFDSAGNRLWEWDREQKLDGEPVTLLPEGVLLATGGQFERFTKGMPPGLPTTEAERRKLAQELARRYERLDEDEKLTLRKLGDAGFEALAAHCKDLMVRVAKQGKERDLPLAEDTSYHLYSALLDLSEQMKPRYTGIVLDMIALAEKQKQPPDDRPIWMLMEGDDRALPYFLRLSRQKGPANPAVIGYMTHSSHPKAVSYLIGRLQDPKADRESRNAAFCSLARTGGQAGLNAVLAARDTRKTFPSLASYMQLDQLPATIKSSRKDRLASAELRSRLIATRKDKRGVAWGLVKSGILGSKGDLWLVHRDGKRWIEPLFTGITYAEGFVIQRKKPTFYGLTQQQMVQEDGWFVKLVGNPELSRDQDRDGWTDKVEQRLGTSPTKADTDADGIPDSRDRNPLGAALPRTEGEQIIAAAFEARFRFLGERDVPCLVSLPKGIRPLAFAGWEGIILTQGEELLPLNNLYGHGVAQVSFYLAEPYRTDSGRLKYCEGDLSRVPPDLQEITISLSTYYNGLDGTGYSVRLKKFGKQWVVIDCHLVTVS